MSAVAEHQALSQQNSAAELVEEGRTAEERNSFLTHVRGVGDAVVSAAAAARDALRAANWPYLKSIPGVLRLIEIVLCGALVFLTGIYCTGRYNHHCAFTTMVMRQFIYLSINVAASVLAFSLCVVFFLVRFTVFTRWQGALHYVESGLLCLGCLGFLAAGAFQCFMIKIFFMNNAGRTLGWFPQSIVAAVCFFLTALIFGLDGIFVFRSR